MKKLLKIAAAAVLSLVITACSMTSGLVADAHMNGHRLSMPSCHILRLRKYAAMLS